MRHGVRSPRDSVEIAFPLLPPALFYTIFVCLRFLAAYLENVIANDSWGHWNDFCKSSTAFTRDTTACSLFAVFCFRNR